MKKNSEKSEDEQESFELEKFNKRYLILFIAIFVISILLQINPMRVLSIAFIMYLIHRRIEYGN